MMRPEFKTSVKMTHKLIFYCIFSLFGSNMHAAYGNGGMPMAQNQQQQPQQQPQQQQQQQQPQQQQQQQTKLSSSSPNNQNYNSYFGQLQNAATDNVMCRPVH